MVWNITRRLCFIGLLVVTPLFPKVAFSANICRALALRDVAAIESSDSVISQGGYDEAITQYNVNKQTKMASFCSHGGYCYPTHVYVNGQKQEALRLVNCKVGVKDSEDSEQTYYSIDVVRSKNSAAVLRASDLEDKFREMGLCSACAGNVASYYVSEPNSECGKLAKQALEGSSTAANKLRDFPSYCEFVPLNNRGSQVREQSQPKIKGTYHHTGQIIATLEVRRAPEGYTVKLMGGVPRNLGASTPADCTIDAHETVRHGILEADFGSSEHRNLRIVFQTGKVQVAEAETFGYCGMGATFLGLYR